MLVGDLRAPENVLHSSEGSALFDVCFTVPRGVILWCAHRVALLDCACLGLLRMCALLGWDALV